MATKKPNSFLIFFFVLLGVFLLLLSQSTQVVGVYHQQPWALVFEKELVLLHQLKTEEKFVSHHFHLRKLNGEGEWKKAVQAKGKVVSLSTDGKWLYIFYPTHYCFYNGELALQGTVDYPKNFSPLTTGVRGEKIILFGRQFEEEVKGKEPDKVKSKVVALELSEEKVTTLSPQWKWEKGLHNFRAVHWRDRTYLFCVRDKMVHYVEMGRERFRRPRSTTLRGGGYDISVSPDGKELYILGEPKLGDETVRIRILTTTPPEGVADRLQFVPQPDLSFPADRWMSAMPQAFAFTVFEGDFILFVARGNGIHYSRYQNDQWQEWKAVEGMDGSLFGRGNQNTTLGWLSLLILALIVLSIFFIRTPPSPNMVEAREKVEPGEEGPPSQVSSSELPPLASVSRRCAAFVIDGFLILFVLRLLVMDPSWQELPIEEFARKFQIYCLVIGLPYFMWSEFTYGQSLGKKLFSIKVINEFGEKPGFREAFIRASFLILEAPPPFFGVIIMAFTKKSQRLGDLLARTYVVEDLPYREGDSGSSPSSQ